MTSEIQIAPELEKRFQNLMSQSPAELAELRSQAWTHFTNLGLPHPKMEAFQYCRRQHLTLEDWSENTFSQAAQVEAPLFHEVSTDRYLASWDIKNLELDANIPGALTVKHLTANELSSLESLNQIISEEELSDSSKDTLAHLNDALFEDALVIRLEKPSDELALKGLQLNLRQLEGQGHFSKVFIHLGPSVELKVAIVEEVFKSSFNHWSIHIQLEEGAQLEFSRVQISDEESSALTHIEILQAAKSNYRQIQATMGSRLGRVSILNLLQGEEAESNFYGVSVLDEKLQSHTYLQLEHQAPHTESTQRFSQALMGQSLGSFDGTVVVAKDAQKVNSDQLIKTLMLSTQAKAQGKPNLKIYADDVKCAHGNTCGQLEEDYLFYLMSRGIAKAEAREILTRGFVEDILNEIHLPILRNAVDEHMLSRLK